MADSNTAFHKMPAADIDVFNEQDAQELRANGGVARIGLFVGDPVLILHTVEKHPPFLECQAKTGRVIPVFELAR